MNNVLASDVRSGGGMHSDSPLIYCDVTDKDNLSRIVLENRITHVVHLATLLSAVGERNPQLALRVNTIGIQNVLDVAVQSKLTVRCPPCSIVLLFCNAFVMLEHKFYELLKAAGDSQQAEMSMQCAVTTPAECVSTHCLLHAS